AAGQLDVGCAARNSYAKSGSPGLFRARREKSGHSAIGLLGDPRDVARKLGAIGLVCHVGRAAQALDDLPVSSSHLRVLDTVGYRVTAIATRTRGLTVRWPLIADAVASTPETCHGAGKAILSDGDPVRNQVLVNLVVERRTQRRVGGEVSQNQRNDRDRRHG